MDKYKIYPKQFRNTKIPIEKNRCFFIMPFSEEFDIVYGAIKNGLSDKYVCSRVDEVTGSTPIINKILVEILKSQFIIVDLTNGNPNVFYELGIAHTFKDAQNIFLLKDKNYKVPFDITHLTYLEYDRKNLKYVIAQLKEAISENKYISDFYEALNAHGIIPFQHDNQEYAIELLTELIGEHLPIVTDLLNYCCTLSGEKIVKTLLYVSSEIKKELTRSDASTTSQLMDFYFELLLSANQYCNIESMLCEILDGTYWINTEISNKELISLQTDCALKFARKHQRLNITMPWIINYFKQSRFATVDLNRYKLESFLMTNQYDEINRMIGDALCDTDAHIREHFSNIIGEKRLRGALDILTTQLLCEENYYTAASMIEAIGKIGAKSNSDVIRQWIFEHADEILKTKSYFVLRHTLIALTRLDADIASQFKQEYLQYLEIHL